MSVISGSVSKNFVTRASKTAKGFPDGNVPISRAPLADSDSVTFEFTKGAVEYMLEHGIIEKRETMHLAAVMGKMYQSEQRVQRLAIGFSNIYNKSIISL